MPTSARVRHLSERSRIVRDWISIPEAGVVVRRGKFDRSRRGSRAGTPQMLEGARVGYGISGDAARRARSPCRCRGVRLQCHFDIPVELLD